MKYDLLYTKSVKIGGKAYKVATNRYGAKYVVYRTIDDIVYGYPMLASAAN